MTSLCDHCTCRGDFHSCSNTPCGQHDSWYAQQLLLKLEAAKKALKFYADGKHYDTVALEDHPVTGLKHTRLLDNGGIAEETLAWINEAEDASTATFEIDPEYLEVTYEEQEPKPDMNAVAHRLQAALNDHAVWSIGVTEGDGKPPILVVYRAPAFLPLEVPPTFEGFDVVLQTASKPVMF